jgi:hypothetical protein
MIGDDKISAVELAYVLDLTPTRVRQLTVEGVLSCEKGRRGREYELKTAIGEFVTYKLETEIVTPELAELQRQRARKLAADTERAEFNLLVLKAKYLNSEAVARVIAEQTTTIKNSLLHLPDRLYNAIAGQTDPDAIRELLQSGVEFALSALRNIFVEELGRSNEEVARLEKTTGRPNDRSTNHDDE